MNNEMPDTPTWLTENGKDIFFKVCVELMANGGLADIDKDLIAGYAQQMSAYQNACREYEKFTTQKDREFWHRVQKDTLTMALNIGVKFGLTPHGQRMLNSSIEEPKTKLTGLQELLKSKPQ